MDCGVTGALVVGLAAGSISTLGFAYLTPLLERSIGLGDTCGVHNLHGIPGIIGGLVRVLERTMMTPAYPGGIPERMLSCPLAHPRRGGPIEARPNPAFCYVRLTEGSLCTLGGGLCGIGAGIGAAAALQPRGRFRLPDSCHCGDAGYCNGRRQSGRLGSQHGQSGGSNADPCAALR